MCAFAILLILKVSRAGLEPATRWLKEIVSRALLVQWLDVPYITHVPIRG